MDAHQMKLTPEQIEEEWHIRYQERLGMLCGAAEPSPEERKIARAEADSWREQWKKENP